MRPQVRRVRWSASEEAMLVEGVERFGAGAWARIRDAYPFHNRSNVDLKDKWRLIGGDRAVAAEVREEAAIHACIEDMIRKLEKEEAARQAIHACIEDMIRKLEKEEAARLKRKREKDVEEVRPKEEARLEASEEAARQREVRECLEDMITSLENDVDYKAARQKRKREKDVATFGNNLSNERQASAEFVEAWMTITGQHALVLNDSTLADILLGVSPGEYVATQVMTATARKGLWKYAKVRGYPSMAVLCWCRDTGVGWVCDGAALDARGPVSLSMTPGGRNCEYALVRQAAPMAALVEQIRANLHLWPRTTEDAARSNFKSVTHAKEFKGIEAYKARVGAGASFAWPHEQGSHVDLLEDGDVRLQFKTARTVAEKSGFMCHMKTAAGTSPEGKQRWSPYVADTFDFLVIVAWPDAGTACFWKIPTWELEDRGYLRDASQLGKQTLWVHGPEGVGRTVTRIRGRGSTLSVRRVAVTNMWQAIVESGALMVTNNVLWCDLALGGSQSCRATGC